MLSLPMPPCISTRHHAPFHPGPNQTLKPARLALLILHMMATCRSLNKSLELEIKSALRRGGNDTLNIYFMDASPFLGEVRACVVMPTCT